MVDTMKNLIDKVLWVMLGGFLEKHPEFWLVYWMGVLSCFITAVFILFSLFWGMFD